MDKSTAIEKVKLLLRLASNTSSNEAFAAKAMANKLIEKYELTEEEYLDKEAKPIYTDDNFLFEEVVHSDWRAQLALICGDKFDCYIIQEKSISVITGDIAFKFFIYGQQDDISVTRSLFEYLSSKCQALIDENCAKRGELYRSSYAEGLVSGARGNIERESFNIPGLTNVVKEAAKEETKISSSIEKVKESKKDKPIEEVTQINTKEKPLDIFAYFIGEQHGANVHLSEYSSSKKLDKKKTIWNRLFNLVSIDDDLNDDLSEE